MTTTELGPSALEVSGLSKSFSGSRVLDSIQLTVEPGEVHALLGENGSGKSTLIKILSGYHHPDDDGGLVAIGGQPLTFGSADSAHEIGARFVHQDLGLVDDVSILDNLSLTTGYPRRFGTIRRRKAVAAAVEALTTLELTVSPTALVGTLSPAEKTGVALARALQAVGGRKIRLLVLDEPTATLPDAEVQRLLAMVRLVATRGTGVLYVTHRLDEVFQIAQTVTVLRDGRKVTTRSAEALTRRELIRLLVGSEFAEIHRESAAVPEAVAEPVLRVRSLAGGRLRGVSFEARPGEVIGVAGITGSGREVLCGAIFGALDRESGEVEVNGRGLRPSRPDLAIGLGLAYVPADRRNHGACMDLTARENLSINGLRPFWRPPAIRKRLETAEAERWFERLDVRPKRRVSSRLSTFSGGNQQKILLGKWLRSSPEVLLISEPTQGVDVGAKAEIHRQMLAAAGGGAAVILATSDTDELAAVCHRVLVLRDGVVAAVLTGQQITNTRLAAECNGATGGNAA